MKTPTTNSAVSFSIIKTGEAVTREGLTYAGGSLRQPAKIIYSAVLVKHPQGEFLFDSGLGNNIDAQYQSDIPRWKRLFLHYGAVTSAHAQLTAAHYPAVPRIFLSHGHWDHASGIVDFPDAEIWVTAEEKTFLDHTLLSKKPFGPAVLPSQVGHESIHWHTYELNDQAYLGFARSYDIFGDGSAVLVPLEGHTPGSVGLVLTLPSRQRIFFCGDTVWNARALDRALSKPWLARLIADHNPATLQHTIQRLAAIRAQHPDIIIVPAHDARVQEQFGFFPHFYHPKAS